MADDIEVRFLAVGNTAVVSAFDQVSNASAKTEAQIKRFDAANDNAFKRLNEGTSKGARAFGALTMSARELDGAFGKVAGTAMRVSETVMTFGTFLGGPWGIALGLAVAGVSALSSAMAENKRETEEAAEAQRKFAEAAAKTNLEMMNAEQAALKNFNAMAPSVVGRASGENATLADVNAAEQAADAQGRIFDRVDAGKDASKRGGKSSFDLAAENQARIADLREQEREAERAQIADDLMRDQAAADARLEIKRAALEQSFELENEAREQTRAAEDEMYERSAASAEANAATIRTVGAGAFGAVAGAGLDAFRKLAQGQKMSTKEVLAGIGDQIAASGQGHMLQAGAMAWIPGMQGNAGGLFAAGALEFAFGVGLGAATRGGGGSGGGGGRSPHARRGESGGDYLDRSRAESPSGSRSGSGGGTTVIYVTNQFPATLSPNVDDAIRMQKAWNEGARAGVVPRGLGV